jgi:hypothetical protein
LACETKVLSITLHLCRVIESKTKRNITREIEREGEKKITSSSLSQTLKYGEVTLSSLNGLMEKGSILLWSVFG